MTAIPGSFADRSATTPAAAIRSGLVRALDFRGRTGRAEYWWFVLMNVLAQSILTQVDLMVLGTPALSIAWAVLALVPGLSAAVRRMHDIGLSGRSLLVALIPVVGAVVVLMRLCREGDRGANRFG